MKKGTLKNGLLKVITLLIIVLIILISFLGIHKRNLNKWENVIPGFHFSKELSETRVFGFTIDESTEEVEVSQEDETTNSTEPEDSTTEEIAEISDVETQQTTIEVPVNDSSVLTKENYQKSKEIVEKRLRTFGITDTIVTVDENTGALSVETPYSSDIANYTIDLLSPGKLQVIDTDTEEVLITRDMITKAERYYQQSSESTADEILYNLGIKLSLTKEGKNKLREISKTYIETTDENSETNKKTITIELDDRSYTTWFLADEEYDSLPMMLYQYVSADDMEQFNDDYNECLIAQIIVNTDTLPIVYELTSGTYIESNLNKSFVKNLSIIGIIALAVVLLVTIAKYKKIGILASIVEIGYIALHLLLIRLAGVSLTLTGLMTIALMAIANYLLVIAMINQEKTIEKLGVFGKFILIIIPFIITMIVFTLGKEINIQSIGMVGIWGILAFACTLVTSMILFNTQNEKKNGVEKDEK